MKPPSLRMERPDNERQEGKTPGELYILEGPDQVGKTTLARAFTERLRETGRDTYYMAFPGNEEGSLGRLVYNLHHDPHAYDVESIDAASLQVLHVAAHIDAIEQRIRPLLQQGGTVVLDRWWISTWVYGKVSGVEVSSLETLIDLERGYWERIDPAAVFLIDRQEPLGPVNNRKRWKRLQKEYQEFPAWSQLSAALRVVENSGSVTAAVDTLMNVTQPIREQ